MQSDREDRSADSSQVMQISINGKPHSAAIGITVQALLTQLGYKSFFMAVAVGDEVIPKAKWEVFQILPGQSVEIVKPMQGG